MQRDNLVILEVFSPLDTCPQLSAKSRELSTGLSFGGDHSGPRVVVEVAMQTVWFLASLASTVRELVFLSADSFDRMSVWLSASPLVADCYSCLIILSQV